MGKRKYPKVQEGYWVYSIKIPSVNKFYIGISKQQCSRRWKKAKYKETSLNQYIQEWDSMEKIVLVEGLTREEALKYEDNIIRELRVNDLCINKYRSGLIFVTDKNTYNRKRLKLYRENNLEYREYDRQYKKQRYQTDAEYRERVKQYNKKYKLKKKLEKHQNQLTLFDEAS